jgi:GNAT superfamily N-acetyltransferase
LIVAEDGGRAVGFVLTGPGFTSDGAGLDPAVGVVCAVGVVPSHRRKGVGAELLARAESHLRDRGARTLLAGSMPPHDPFLFGLYGGTQTPGFLESDAAAKPFFEKHGYRAERARLVYQRQLDRPPTAADPRFAALRANYEIHVAPLSACSWREECVYGPLEMHDYQLVEKAGGRPVARAALWEMETFSPGWNEHAVGFAGLEVAPELRRKALAKFLVGRIVRYLHEQFYTLAEVHAEEGDAAAEGLLLGLGFCRVDRGVCYQREIG